MSGLDDRKVCFIICSSDALYTEECLHYINHLTIPVGFQIEVLTVEDAASMTAGYNEGMQASAAKYKVYLHQDVFIVNHNFIQDFLDIFESDEQIGMIGMVGAPKLPTSGIMWEAERCGAIYVPAYLHDALSQWGNQSLMEVEAIDGLMMITQYDIPWREDVFDKWDFYDCSQSQEFIRRGYKVVVPAMEKPWCLHDSTLADLSAYEGERMKFLQEYFGQKKPEQGMAACGITVVVTTYERCSQLRDTLQWLADVEGISNIIVVDNGSTDDTESWLAEQQYEYVRFDEGVQGYGRLWNTVLQNFETQDCIVFLEAGVYPEPKSLAELRKILRSEEIGIVSPVSNDSDIGVALKSREDLVWISQSSLGQTNRKPYDETMRPNWKIWAIRRDVLEKYGLFREELSHPKEVLTDYSLKILQNGLRQVVCNRAIAYENFDDCREVYSAPLVDQWQAQDRSVMKDAWGMNYFNLLPNRFLIKAITEETEAAFRVLEIGCDLGATLLAIRNRYPQCKTCGLEINRAAVEIAKHLTDVRYGNIDELAIPFQEKFDYIIFGDVLEHLRHPEEVIRMCRDQLNDGGHIIASIPNVMHISVMEELIDGRFRYQDVGLLDRTHIHFFTFYEIMQMFQKSGYYVGEVERITTDLSDRQQAMMATLLGLSDQTEEWMYQTFQYVVKAQKQ